MKCNTFMYIYVCSFIYCPTVANANSDNNLPSHEIINNFTPVVLPGHYHKQSITIILKKLKYYFHIETSVSRPQWQHNWRGPHSR